MPSMLPECFHDLTQRGNQCDALLAGRQPQQRFNPQPERKGCSTPALPRDTASGVVEAETSVGWQGLIAEVQGQYELIAWTRAGVQVREFTLAVDGARTPSACGEQRTRTAVAQKVSRHDGEQAQSLSFCRGRFCCDADEETGPGFRRRHAVGKRFAAFR